MALERDRKRLVTRATSKRLGPAESGAGDDDNTGSIDGGHELSSLEAGALTEATEASVFDEGQHDTAGYYSYSVASCRRRRHAHVICKSGGVFSISNGTVGRDDVRPRTVAFGDNNRAVTVLDATNAAVGDMSSRQNVGVKERLYQHCEIVGAPCRYRAKCTRKTSAVETAGSRDVPSEDSASRAARILGPGFFVNWESVEYF